MLDPDAAREHLLTDRRGVVEATIECANAVAASAEARWEHALGVLNALRLAGYERISMEAKE